MRTRPRSKSQHFAPRLGRSAKIAKHGHRTGRTRRATTRLGFEPLEARALLAADPGWAFALPGPAYDIDSTVNIAPDGALYASGSFQGTVDFDPGAGTFNLTSSGSNGDGFVAKYTPNGALIWATNFGGTSLDYCYSMDFDASGNVYVTGHSWFTSMNFGGITVPNQGGYDAYVAKLDGTTGTFQWAHGLGGPEQDTGNDLKVNAAGDVFVTGTFRGTADFDPGPGVFNLTEAGGTNAGDAFVWKLDTNGIFQWARQFGAPTLENGQRLALDGDGYVYAAGTFRDTVDFGQPGNPLPLTAPKSVDADIFMVKIDESTGDSVWARQATGPEHINAAWIATDGAGDIYLAGGFEGEINFGTGTPSLVSAGAADVFLSKWDTDGNIIWAESLASGADNAIPRTLQVDPAGNLLMAIEFDGSADFDPGVPVNNLTSAGLSDGAVLKLNADGSFDWVRQITNTGDARAESIVADSAGNIYVSGLFQDSVTLPTGHVLLNPGTGTFFMKLALGDPPTKFYVADDSSANRSYEYDASGSTNGNNALNTGNSTPRGAASTAAGDRVWVVDANRKVFVYDINGNLLGSWTAGSMASNATPEGIATNGTDVWIVDAKSDKVFKYTGVANRVSGSQNAASSFNLNSGNRSPKDIVTDGTSLWVVNDSTTDKVFKYTVGGSLLGSWTIGSANSKPTGLTIDPSNVGDIWIVDSGTDSVYQYVGAASRVSGSQAAAATFALAAGNSNPQGIADPPVAAPMQHASSMALGSSMSSVNAVEFDAPFRSRSVEKQPVKKSVALLARHEVFASFAPERNSVPICPAPLLSDDIEMQSDGFSDEQGNLDSHMADIAIESAFASVF